MASKSLDGLSAPMQGFLIASMLFRAREHSQIFAQFPHEDAQLLDERARILLQMDKAKRMQLLVAELKRFILMSEQPWILAIHPSWIHHIFENEEEIIKSVALASLSCVAGERLARYSFELLTHVRSLIEAQLTPMRQVPFDLCFTPEQLLVLTRDELKRVVARAGIESVSQFIAKEPILVQTEIAQRLEFNMGQRLLQCSGRDVHSDVDLFTCVTSMAMQGHIDERFSKCIRPS